MRRPVFILLLLGISLFLPACGRSAQPAGTFAWIDAPINGLKLPLGQLVTLEGHAASDQGIASVVFWVNGEELVEQFNPETVGKLAHFEHIWMPEKPGNYTILLVAFGQDGSSSPPDSITLQVSGEAETPTLEITLTATGTLEPTRMTPTLETPTLEPTRTLTPLPPDTTGPPPPTPISPAGGDDLGCIGTVLIQWSAVSDPSGIAEYRLVLQRHGGDDNWAAVSGSPWAGITGTSQSVTVECAWYYRWRVQARDQADNWGDYSSWVSFLVSIE